MKLATNRRGSIYLVVLATSALVVTMALLGLELARRDIFAAVVIKDSVEARLAAESGVDQAIAFMQMSGWRTRVGGGTIGNGVALGAARYSVSIVDTTGDITVPSFNVLKVTAVGNSGNSQAKLQVLAKATRVVPEHFDNVVCAQQNLSFETSTVAGSGTIRAGTGSLAALSSITHRVNVGTTALGVTYNGGTAVSPSPLSTIDMTSVIDYYENIGTSVSLSQLPSGSIDKQVISPDVTPWGVTNTYGVYIIDCENNNIIIKDSRIIATLVFINATAGITVSKSVNWVPGLATYPVILSDGKVSLNTDAAALSEAVLNVNFNPPGAAGTGRVGVTDADKLDSYSSRISGLVVANSLELGIALRLFGTAISQTSVRFQNSTQLVYDSAIRSNTPPGFTFVGDVYLTEGTWKRTLD